VDQKLMALMKKLIQSINITVVFGMVVQNIIVQILLIIRTTMEDLYEQTIEKSEQMKKAGYNLIEMWECNWLNLKYIKKK
jgi:hypothetical protein